MGTVTVAVDDCWRRIGVLGDGSCPLLAEHIHCRNCPTYSRAALTLLDNLPTGEVSLPDGHAVHANATASGPAMSCLVFRIGDEWLALPAGALALVTAPCPVHSLPHRRHAAVLGLASVRGNLLVCISLARLLGQDPAAGAAANAAANAKGSAGHGARLLVLGQGRTAIALPVDEVTGIERIGEADLQPLPTTLSRASAHYTRALLTSGQRTVGLLDPALLQQALKRSLA
ncbi:Chemotaxis signal transduction protein [Cupriavidus basilensis]|uniref:Chemotaxis protein CheW n=2 Tax=Cupriavidus basilensis TaxID=68895 RepID=A0A0C4YRB3_9BURK|nr:chemotaxis protein CheW [Cupriavidus basilensis]AJG24529.1 Chemotaxis signal transduction protein [Cupriavidus basilensis]